MRVDAGMNVPRLIQVPRIGWYMTLYNEARRNDGLTELYSAETIYNYASGKNIYRYPNVDYYSDQYLKKHIAIMM